MSRVRTSLRHRLTRLRGEGERGQAGLLTLGLSVVAIALILVTVGTTSAQLARMQLLDAADAAALDAADALDAGAYQSGVGEAVPVTDQSVRDAASAYLARAPRPDGVLSWGLGPATGSPDGQSAVVQLTGTADLPYVGAILSAVGGSVTITVESRARAGLDPLGP